MSPPRTLSPFLLRARQAICRSSTQYIPLRHLLCARHCSRRSGPAGSHARPLSFGALTGSHPGTSSPPAVQAASPRLPRACPRWELGHSHGCPHPPHPARPQGSPQQTAQHRAQREPRTGPWPSSRVEGRPEEAAARARGSQPRVPTPSRRLAAVSGLSHHLGAQLQICDSEAKRNPGTSTRKGAQGQPRSRFPCSARPAPEAVSGRGKPLNAPAPRPPRAFLLQRL